MPRKNGKKSINKCLSFPSEFWDEIDGKLGDKTRSRFVYDILKKVFKEEDENINGDKHHTQPRALNQGRYRSRSNNETEI